MWLSHLMEEPPGLSQLMCFVVWTILVCFLSVGVARCWLLTLLDGHGSHPGLELLEHTNDPERGWVVCTGLPCGTC